MARLIYVLLAAALVALVVGFVVQTTTVPLFISIGLSCLVVVLILSGTARRARQERALAEADEELEEIGLADEEAEAAVLAAVRAGRRPPRYVPGIDDDEDEIEFGDEELDELSLEDEAGERTPDDTMVIGAARPSSPHGGKRAPATRSGSRRKPKAAARPAAKRAAKKGSAGPKAKPATKPSRVVVVPGRPRFHRRSCRFVKGKETSEIALSTAQRRRYSPCSVCKPA